MKFSNIFKFAPLAAVLGVLTLGLAPTAASATSITATIAVSAIVQSTCIVSASGLAFGTYISTAASINTATVTVTCTSTTPYTLGLDAGQGGGSVTTRKMKNGAALLNYALFSDSTRLVNWGNSSGSWVTGTGNGVAQPITVYGQVAASQYILPGAYGDTIVATVSY